MLAFRTPAGPADCGLTGELDDARCSWTGSGGRICRGVLDESRMAVGPVHAHRIGARPDWMHLALADDSDAVAHPVELVTAVRRSEPIPAVHGSADPAAPHQIVPRA